MALCSIIDKMALKMNLRSLLDLAIAKPEAGTVNFKVLHSFLQKLLGHLAVADAEVEVIEIYFPFNIGRKGAQRLSLKFYMIIRTLVLRYYSSKMLIYE